MTRRMGKGRLLRLDAARDDAPARSRRAATMEIVKPAITSSSDIRPMIRKAELPAPATRMNSTRNTMKTSMDNVWLITETFVVRVARKISKYRARMPRTIRESPKVATHSPPQKKTAEG